MKPQPFMVSNQSRLLLIVISLLILAALLRSNLSSTAVSTHWNTQIPDITRNHNAILALYLLETKNAPAPVAALARDVLAAPANYYGKYLQISGTVQSIQAYPAQNNLPGSILGNTSEFVVIAGDGATLVDCLIVNNGFNPVIGSNITINGYTPGVRYIQNYQAAAQELVIIGSLV